MGYRLPRICPVARANRGAFLFTLHQEKEERTKKKVYKEEPGEGRKNEKKVYKEEPGEGRKNGKKCRKRKRQRNF